MQNHRAIVITLGNKDEHLDSATKLGRAFYNTEEVTVASFECIDGNFFNGIFDSQLNELVFLGHGNPKQFNTHSAASFAFNFDQLFTASRRHATKSQLIESKKFIQHVYLVGCDVGLIDKNGKSLAQEIAAKLYKKGYTNIQVHAYAAVQTNKDDSLVVKVITQEGIQGLTSRLSEYAGNAAGKPMVIEGNLAAELINDKTKDTLQLLGGAAPKQELNRPANTFGPESESLKARTERVDQQTAANEVHTRAQAIALLYQRSQYLQYMARTNPVKAKLLAGKFKMLDKFVTDLNKAANGSDDDWRNALSSMLDKVRTSLIFKRNGNTEKLVRALSNRNDLRVSELTEQQNERESLARSSEPKKSPSLKPKAHASPVIDLDNGVPTHQQEPPIKTDGLSDALQKEIYALILTLAQEIDAMNARCFSFFKTYEINTKIEKHNMLNLFFDQSKGGIGVTRAKAYEIALAASQDSRIMRSKKTTRTRDIINKILSETAEFGEIPNENTSINASLLDKKMR